MPKTEKECKEWQQQYNRLHMNAGDLIRAINIRCMYVLGLLLDIFISKNPIVFWNFKWKFICHTPTFKTYEECVYYWNSKRNQMPTSNVLQITWLIKRKSGWMKLQWFNPGSWCRHNFWLCWILSIALIEFFMLID